MELQSPELTFPTAFCCNCGDTNCQGETQHTAITRYFAIYGAGTTFALSVPVCAGCLKTLRRRPSGFFARLLVLLGAVGAWFLLLYLLGTSVVYPAWMSGHLWEISAALGS